MAYAIGHISGGHFNPAVSVGLVAAGRFPAKDLLPYIVAQVIGAIVGAAVLYLIASGKAGFAGIGGFASNGYGEHSPGGYSLTSALVTEVVLTFMFLMIILGATHGRAPAGFAPIAIGLALTLIHLISIPVTNTSVNPARTTGAGAVRRRLGAAAALAVLGGADRRRGDRRLRPQGAVRKGLTGTASAKRETAPSRRRFGSARSSSLRPDTGRHWRRSSSR